MGKTTKTDRKVRTHDGMEKVEADFTLIVPIGEIDALVGKPRNPEECAIAVGAKRLFGCTFASVGVSRATFALMDPDGVRRLYVFSVPKQTRKAIENYDETGVIPLGGFRFGPIKRADSAAYRKELNDKRQLEGYVPANPKGAHPQRITLVDPDAVVEATPAVRKAPTRDGRSVNRGSTFQPVNA